MMDINILCGITHLVHTHFEPLAQATSEIGMDSCVTIVEPTMSLSKPISSIHSYVSPIVTTYI